MCSDVWAYRACTCWAFLNFLGLVGSHYCDAGRALADDVLHPPRRHVSHASHVCPAVVHHVCSCHAVSAIVQGRTARAMSGIDPLALHPPHATVGTRSRSRWRVRLSRETVFAMCVKGDLVVLCLIYFGRFCELFFGAVARAFGVCLCVFVCVYLILLPDCGYLYYLRLKSLPFFYTRDITFVSITTFRVQACLQSSGVTRRRWLAVFSRAPA